MKTAIGILGLLLGGTSPSYEQQTAVISSPSGVDGSCAVANVGEALHSPIVLHNIATCHYLGEGLPQNLELARTLYSRAAEQGFEKSFCALGNMYIAGQGGPRDIDQGLDLCRRAAEAGDADAQTDLAGYLLQGKVTGKDAVAARRWLLRAAEQGHPNAAMLLGKMLWNGDGVTKDNAEAARWWRVADKGGRTDAALLLGNEAFVRLTRGVKSPEDADPAIIEEAISWYERAANIDPVPENRARAQKQAASLSEFLQRLQQHHQ